MTIHRKVQRMFYEYLQDELSLPDRQAIETHIASCGKCLLELDRMRSTLGLMAAPSTRASEMRSDHFWAQMADSILKNARARNSKGMRMFPEIMEWMEELLALHPGYTLGTAGTVAALLVVLAVWTFRPPGNREAEFTAGQALSTDETLARPAVMPERVNQYFRKSKTLLVGLTNLRTDEAAPLDFSKERRVSRDLIRETRYLRQQPIDPRAKRLMDDIERILIELSTLDEHRDLSDVDIVRSGIHHENLLFKIRMAEATYDSRLRREPQ